MIQNEHEMLAQRKSEHNESKDALQAAEDALQAAEGKLNYLLDRDGGKEELLQAVNQEAKAFKNVLANLNAVRKAGIEQGAPHPSSKAAFARRGGAGPAPRANPLSAPG